MNRYLCAALSLPVLAAASGCANEVKAPFDQGVCYSVTLADDGKSAPTFNVLARDQPQIE